MQANLQNSSSIYTYIDSTRKLLEIALNLHTNLVLGLATPRGFIDAVINTPYDRGMPFCVGLISKRSEDSTLIATIKTLQTAHKQLSSVMPKKGTTAASGSEQEPFSIPSETRDMDIMEAVLKITVISVGLTNALNAGIREWCITRKGWKDDAYIWGQLTPCNDISILPYIVHENVADFGERMRDLIALASYVRNYLIPVAETKKDTLH